MGNPIPKFNFNSFRDLLESCKTILREQDELIVGQSDFDPWLDTHPRLVCTPQALQLVLSNALYQLSYNDLIFLIWTATETDEDFQENFSVLDGSGDSFTTFLGELVGMQIYDRLRADSEILELVELRQRQALQDGADVHRDEVDTGLVGWPK